MLQKERNRQAHFNDKAAKHCVCEIIKALQKQLELIEQEIKDRINKDNAKLSYKVRKVCWPKDYYFFCLIIPLYLFQWGDVYTSF
jgi:hypothetical protein